jgi:hypothetical protein
VYVVTLCIKYVDPTGAGSAAMSVKSAGNWRLLYMICMGYHLDINQSFLSERVLTENDEDNEYE